jgi:hypothetical protein
MASAYKQGYVKQAMDVQLTLVAAPSAALAESKFLSLVP